MRVPGCFAHVIVVVAYREQKRASDPMKQDSGFTGCCEPHKRGAEHWTQILCKSSKHISLLNWLQSSTLLSTYHSANTSSTECPEPRDACQDIPHGISYFSVTVTKYYDQKKKKVKKKSIFTVPGKESL